MEVEIKIRLDDAGSVMQKAESLGAKKISQGMYHDVYYDNGQNFFGSGKTLRIRTGDGKTLLTFKDNPVDDNMHIVSRPEIQTNADEPEKLHEIFDKLGFKPYIMKEKKFVNYQFEDVVLEFHQLPFLGDFLEIEAPESKLNTVLPKLGLSTNQGTSESYNQLFKQYKSERGLPEIINDTFEEAKKFLMDKNT